MEMDGGSVTYIAHKGGNGEEQALREHCEAVAKLSCEGAVAELRELCELIGLLHDVGKYQESFQKRINGANITVEHSICGAKEVSKRFGNSPMALLAELCIAGHHSGIPDCGTCADLADKSTLFGRLKRETEDYSDYLREMTIPKPSANAFNDYLMRIGTTKASLIELFAFLTRYCFSCLVDADSLDTAQATHGKTERTLTADFAACEALLAQKLRSFRAVTELQKTRACLQAQAFSNIGTPAELYLMNMPTGSGKTLASMRCALERARLSKKKRIIYIIPYNSIIEQTAEEFERLFGSKAQILRHQSTFSYEDAENLTEDERETAKFACENWDAQIIITTAVQFFESIYANRRGKLRKLHNMAHSVLVFDEAHLMPREFLQPCLMAVALLTRCLHSEAIFLTATMPNFRKLMERYTLPDAKIVDLVPDRSAFPKFAKCEYRFIGEQSDEALLHMAAQSPASLIIVNSRRAARALFRLCSGKKYHLSTYMTGYDRSAQIRRIRQELEALYKEYPMGENVPPERRITVISTSLIEAGVDLDFVAVYRELAGLDSILQAGGRCNREGLRKNGVVSIFTRQDGCATQDVRQNITAGILHDYPNIDTPEAIEAFYDRLFFTTEDELTAHSVSRRCKSLDTIPFRSYSEEMKLIGTKTVSIAVSRDAVSEAVIAQMRESGFGSPRKLQKYCCSVYPYEFETLLKQHVVEDYGTGIYCLTNPDYYDAEVGIVFEGKDIIF